MILEKKILKTFLELNPFFKIFKFSKIKIEATAGWESVDVCLRQMLLVKQNDNKCNDDPVCDPGQAQYRSHWHWRRTPGTNLARRLIRYPRSRVSGSCISWLFPKRHHYSCHKSNKDHLEGNYQITKITKGCRIVGSTNYYHRYKNTI